VINPTGGAITLIDPHDERNGDFSPINDTPVYFGVQKLLLMCYRRR
jgi:hypothetical protein